MLEDPRDKGQHPAGYSFPGDSEHFARNRVLNHRINCVLSREDFREGILLAVGLRPPETYKNHDKVESTFGILDQWDWEPFAKLQMTLNRLPARVKAILEYKRGPLFTRRDIIGPARSSSAPAVSTAESREKDGEDIRRLFEEGARFRTKHGHARVPTGPNGR